MIVGSRRVVRPLRRSKFGSQTGRRNHFGLPFLEKIVQRRIAINLVPPTPCWPEEASMPVVDLVGILLSVLALAKASAVKGALSDAAKTTLNEIVALIKRRYTADLKELTSKPHSKRNLTLQSRL